MAHHGDVTNERDFLEYVRTLGNQRIALYQAGGMAYVRPVDRFDPPEPARPVVLVELPAPDRFFYPGEADPMPQWWLPAVTLTASVDGVEVYQRPAIDRQAEVTDDDLRLSALKTLAALEMVRQLRAERLNEGGSK